MWYGWWFAGDGYDGSAVGDFLLGSCEIGYAAGATDASGKNYGCKASAVGLQPGNVNNPCDMMHFWSLHPGGVNFALADGSVRFVSYSANNVLPALVTRAGGETVNDY